MVIVCEAFEGLPQLTVQYTLHPIWCTERKPITSFGTRCIQVISVHYEQTGFTKPFSILLFALVITIATSLM